MMLIVLLVLVVLLLVLLLVLVVVEVFRFDDPQAVLLHGLRARRRVTSVSTRIMPVIRVGSVTSSTTVVVDHHDGSHHDVLQTIVM